MADIVRLSTRQRTMPDPKQTLRLLTAFVAIEDAEAREKLVSVAQALTSRCRSQNPPDLGLAGLMAYVGDCSVEDE